MSQWPCTRSQASESICKVSRNHGGSCGKAPGVVPTIQRTWESFSIVFGPGDLSGTGTLYCSPTTTRPLNQLHSAVGLDGPAWADNARGAATCCSSSLLRASVSRSASGPSSRHGRGQKRSGNVCWEMWAGPWRESGESRWNSNQLI